MKLGLDPINIFSLPAGTMFSWSTESDKGTVQSRTEEGASHPGSGELFRAAAMAQLPEHAGDPLVLTLQPV